MSLNRSTLLIFRDCLKLIPRMGVEASNVKNVRALMKLQFQKNRNEVDPAKIEQMREGAIRGISNYILMTIKQEYLKNPHPQSQNIFLGNEESDVSDFQESTGR